MRERPTTPISQATPHLDEEWFDFEHAAVVEVSEEQGYLIESALIAGETHG